MNRIQPVGSGGSKVIVTDIYAPSVRIHFLAGEKFALKRPLATNWCYSCQPDRTTDVASR